MEEGEKFVVGFVMPRNEASCICTCHVIQDSSLRKPSLAMTAYWLFITLQLTINNQALVGAFIKLALAQQAFAHKAEL